MNTLHDTPDDKAREAAIRRVHNVGWKDSPSKVDHFWSPCGRRRLPLAAVLAELDRQEKERGHA